MEVSEGCGGRNTRSAQHEGLLLERLGELYEV